ncbi:MAG: SDR family NAD(P)-dependent oxidoreductase [Ilumatobacteraceae bacterium]
MTGAPASDRNAPVVLVTGASGGIGRAVARRFAAGGWRVAGTDIHPGADDGAPFHVVADLRSVADCRHVVERAVQWGRRLDAVVNAAGVWTEGSSAETTEEEFDEVIGVNLKGLYFVTSAAIPHLTATKGCVVNISSDAGLQGNAGAAVYCASKGGVSILTKALALELAPAGVRVNAVCPGDVDSPMLHRQAAVFGFGDPDAYLRRLLDGYPQGAAARFVRVDEVAEMAWFLCQPAAAPITGANLSIDFGLSAGIT